MNTERKNNLKETAVRAVGIVAGSFLYACGIGLFLDPNNLAAGGVLGISVILSRISGLETGTLYFVLNIPIMLLGLWKFGIRFIATTFFGIVCCSAFTNLTGMLEPVTDEPFLAALAGGILVGVGVGLVFKSHGNTGGMDIVVKVLKMKRKYLKTGFIFRMTDVCVVTLSGIVFRNFNVVMYALIAVTVSGWVMDYVLYGSDEAKLIYIISDEPDSIAQRLLSDAEVGVTYLTGKGAYSSREKRVIMCVTKKQQAPLVEEIVKQEDKNAFMIITSANEIYGEGYKNIMSEKI